MESSDGEHLSGTEEARADTEEVQSEFFFDKTEYHKIMAEAIADQPSLALGGGENDPLNLAPSFAKAKEHRRQTFYVGAFLFGMLLLVVGGILFIFG